MILAEVVYNIVSLASVVIVAVVILAAVHLSDLKLAWHRRDAGWAPRD